MRSCRDISALISQGLDKKLRFIERFAIGLYVMMCSGWRNFKNQSQFIRRAAHRYREQLQNRFGKKT